MDCLRPPEGSPPTRTLTETVDLPPSHARAPQLLCFGTPHPFLGTRQTTPEQEAILDKRQHQTKGNTSLRLKAARLGDHGLKGQSS